MAIEVIAHLGKTKDGCDVLITTDKLEPYRLVRGYDPNEEPGQQWSHTVIACDEIGFFAELIVNHNKPISYWKTCEIAEKAISYLKKVLRRFRSFLSIKWPIIENTMKMATCLISVLK